MGESLKTKIIRWRFNLYPPYFAAGARLTYIADDWHEVHLKVPLSWRTRNYVGTIYGGSMYSALDPIYMAMVYMNLGSGYVVWDKQATIQFKKPGRQTLYAQCLLPPGEITTIKATLRDTETTSLERVYNTDLVDRTGLVCATIQITVYVALRAARQEAAVKLPGGVK